MMESCERWLPARTENGILEFFQLVAAHFVQVGIHELDLRLVDRVYKREASERHCSQVLAKDELLCFLLEFLLVHAAQVGVETDELELFGRVHVVEAVAVQDRFHHSVNNQIDVASNR